MSQGRGWPGGLALPLPLGDWASWPHLCPQHCAPNLPQTTPHPTAAHSPHVAPSRLGALPCGHRNMGRVSPLQGQLIEFGFGAISSRRVDPPAHVPGTGPARLSTQSPAVLVAWHLPLRPTQDPRCTLAHKKPSGSGHLPDTLPRPSSARFRRRPRACVRPPAGDGPAPRAAPQPSPPGPLKGLGLPPLPCAHSTEACFCPRLRGGHHVLPGETVQTTPDHACGGCGWEDVLGTSGDSPAGYLHPGPPAGKGLWPQAGAFCRGPYYCDTTVDTTVTDGAAKTCWSGQPGLKAHGSQPRPSVSRATPGWLGPRACVQARQPEASKGSRQLH